MNTSGLVVWLIVYVVLPNNGVVPMLTQPMQNPTVCADSAAEIEKQPGYFPQMPPGSRVVAVCRSIRGAAVTPPPR